MTIHVCFQRLLTLLLSKLENDILATDWLKISLQCLFPLLPFLIFTGQDTKSPCNAFQHLLTFWLSKLAKIRVDDSTVMPVLMHFKRKDGGFSYLKKLLKIFIINKNYKS